MRDIILSLGVPQSSMLFSLYTTYSPTLSDYFDKQVERATRVMHAPYHAPFASRVSHRHIVSSDNILFVGAGSNISSLYVWNGDRDMYKEDHIFWGQREDREYHINQASFSTGKALAAVSAKVTEEREIEPFERVVKCGDIKEHCFTIIPMQMTSNASARLAAITFYLSQLYPRREEVREALEVCAVDIGEQGIDREYGRGIANLLCPRVLEKEVAIVSQYTEEKKNPFKAEGGEPSGTWRATDSPLKVYLPEAVKETTQASLTTHKVPTKTMLLPNSMRPKQRRMMFVS